MAERIFMKKPNVDPDRFYFKCRCGKEWDMGTVTEVEQKKKSNFMFCSYCGREFNYKRVTRGYKNYPELQKRDAEKAVDGCFCDTCRIIRLERRVDKLEAGDN